MDIQLDDKMKELVFGHVQSAIIDELDQMMRKNEDIFVVTADFGLLYKGMGMNYPDRMLDVGIAEPNMIGMASGLAYAGKIVFTTTIAEMATARVTEQIRLDCCYPNLNINMLARAGAWCTVRWVLPTSLRKTSP